MPEQNSKPTIISMAVIASATATLLHEGLGHGVTAWLRGDGVTELTSNHLSSITPDKLVDAGGTIVNLIVGTVCLMASGRMGSRANLRYFLWILGTLNLLPGAGYFLFSGIIGVGDWKDVIAGYPNQALLRTLMTLLGAGLYFVAVRQIARGIRPFVAEPRTYNTVGRYPYYAACLFSCVAGAFDPLGLQLFFLSTVPAAFGGSSGMMWADALLPKDAPTEPLVVSPAREWWIAGLAIGLAYVVILGPGIQFAH
jgi:hypothetical protein